MIAKQRLALVGGGGFGREILDIVDAINAVAPSRAHIEVVGVFDDGQPDRKLLASYDVEHAGTVSDLLDLPDEVSVVVGVAHPYTRSRLVKAVGHRARLTLVHPTATVGRAVRIGRGAVVCSHVSIANHVVIGDDTQIGANSTIGHDCRVGSCVTISPLVAVSGNISLGNGSFLGTGASFKQGLVIGANAVVGSGAAVTQDVEPDTTVVGVPAKPLP